MTNFDYPKLKHESGSDILINENPFSIGRGLSCNYVIPNSVISRQHCVISKENSNWTFRDTSTNGSFLNGSLIKGGTGAPLQDNDVIGLSFDGAYNYTFHNNFKDDISDEQLCILADTVLSEVEVPPVSIVENTVEEPCSSHMVSIDSNTIKPKEPPEKSNSPKQVVNEQIEAMEDEMQCSICSEMFVKAVTLSCAHTFCKYCIETWRKTKDICPICRTKIKTMNSTLVLDNVIEKVLENASDEVKQHRRELLEEREKLLQPIPKPSNTRGHANKARRSRGARGRGTRGRTVPPPAIPVIEVMSSDSDTENSNTDDEGYLDHDYDNWFDVPYYGGYGFCFNCGSPDHWANGCPYR